MRPRLSDIKLDLTRVPFSNRGSRVLVFQNKETPSLFISLAERIADLSTDIEAYGRRPPFIENLFLLDRHGTHLDFELTSTPVELQLETKHGTFRICFVDHRTIAIGLPDHTQCGISFEVNQNHYSLNETNKTKPIRHLLTTTDATIGASENHPTDSGYIEIIQFTTVEDNSLCMRISKTPADQISTAPYSQSLGRSKTAWEEWFADVPPHHGQYTHMYLYAWWVMANNLVSPHGFLTYEAMMPSKAKYVGLWLWDSALHCLAYRHNDPALARNQIRSFINVQLPNGMFPDAIFDEGVVNSLDHPFHGTVTKPPILAWASLKIHEMAPEIEFLKEVYASVSVNIDWWLSQNDDQFGDLVHYSHPYSSGQDNNPLWDTAFPIVSPDINTYLIVEMQAMKAIALVLGLEDQAEAWEQRASKHLEQLIRYLWNPNLGVFDAYSSGARIEVLTPINLLPLWIKNLPDQIKAKLLNHLRNPEEFWGDYMIPSVAKNDITFMEDSMWRGPVWANINYFFIESLTLSGELELANELQNSTLKLIQESGGIYEFYNAINGKAPSEAAPAFGWTAAVYIDLVLQGQIRQ